MSFATVGLLVVAGMALVLQNLLMAKITQAMSTVLIALALNSVVGLAVLSLLLIMRAGTGMIRDVINGFHPWYILPGLLGTFFVFASITGYQRFGAAPTIATLVASQLVFGLVIDLVRIGNFHWQNLACSMLGVVLLIAGVLILVMRQS